MRMLPVAVARSSSDGVAIHYVLPVLRMSSCYHTMGQWARDTHSVMFRRVRQMAVPVERQTTTVFGWVHGSVAPGVKSAVSSSYSSLDWVLSHWAHVTVRTAYALLLWAWWGGPDGIEA